MSKLLSYLFFLFGAYSQGYYESITEIDKIPQREIIIPEAASGSLLYYQSNDLVSKLSTIAFDTMLNKIAWIDALQELQKINSQDVSFELTEQQKKLVYDSLQVIYSSIKKNQKTVSRYSDFVHTLNGLLKKFDIRKPLFVGPESYYDQIPNV